MINKTSALENAETSAVGRALAFLGFAGTEIASADEVANAIKQQNFKPDNVVKPLEVEEENMITAECSNKCCSCDADVTDKVKNFSILKYNKVLCFDCQKKHDKV